MPGVNKFFKTAAGTAVGGVSGAAVGNVGASAYVGSVVTSAATNAAACSVAAGIAPEAAAVVGSVAATNITAGTSCSVAMSAATAAGTEAGLCAASATASSQAACSAAIAKFSTLAWLSPAATVALGFFGAYAGYQLINKLDEHDTQIENINTRMARMDEMLNARSQTHIHNLDSMRDEAMIDLLTCPITCEIIQDPVYMNDNRFYERSAINEWFAMNRVSPVNPAVILDNPNNIPTHRQAKNFLDANRERLLSHEPPQKVEFAF